MDISFSFFSFPRICFLLPLNSICMLSHRMTFHLIQSLLNHISYHISYIISYHVPSHRITAHSPVPTSWTSGGRESRTSARTLVVWTPRQRCAPLQPMHSATPRFTETQSGSVWQMDELVMW